MNLNVMNCKMMNEKHLRLIDWYRNIWLEVKVRRKGKGQSVPRSAKRYQTSKSIARPICKFINLIIVKKMNFSNENTCVPMGPVRRKSVRNRFRRRRMPNRRRQSPLSPTIPTVRWSTKWQRCTFFQKKTRQNSKNFNFSNNWREMKKKTFRGRWNWIGRMRKRRYRRLRRTCRAFLFWWRCGRPFLSATDCRPWPSSSWPSNRPGIRPPSWPCCTRWRRTAGKSVRWSAPWRPTWTTGRWTNSCKDGRQAAGPSRRPTERMPIESLDNLISCKLHKWEKREGKRERETWS